VHALFRPEHVDDVRRNYPDMKVIVHPECKWEVVQKADMAGSTAYIVKTIQAAPPGSEWAIGTEVHLVNRLKNQHPDKKIVVLSDCQCLCTTMYRIDLPHLCWMLENLVEGKVVNQIKVDAETRKWATIALQRMLAIKSTGNPIGKSQPAITTID
jgi:quinolinate synthase